MYCQPASDQFPQPIEVDIGDLWWKSTQPDRQMANEIPAEPWCWYGDAAALARLEGGAGVDMPNGRGLER
jgi:hypothetical protein